MSLTNRQIDDLALAVFGAVADQLRNATPPALTDDSTVTLDGHDYTRDGTSKHFPWISPTNTERCSDDRIRHELREGRAVVKETP